MASRRIRHLIVHRIRVDEHGFAPNGPGVERFFEEGPGRPYTRGKMPYHFVIDEAGVVGACVPIKDPTPHARKYNKSSIAVAVYGDFTQHKPTHAQVCALIGLLAQLKDFYPKAVIVGHTDLPDASTDPQKKCPGDCLPVPRIAAVVKTILEIAESELNAV